MGLVADPAVEAPSVWLVPLLLLLTSAVAVLALGRAAFTAHPTVELYTTEGLMPGVLVEQVNVRCPGLFGSRASARFVSDSGETLFFNEASPTYPDAEVLCSDARGGRWRRLLAVGLFTTFIAGGATAIQLVRRRRHDWASRARRCQLAAR